MSAPEVSVFAKVELEPETDCWRVMGFRMVYFEIKGVIWGISEAEFPNSERKGEGFVS